MLCVRFFSLFVPESFLGLIDFIVPHLQSFEFVLCCVSVCVFVNFLHQNLCQGSLTSPWHTPYVVCLWLCFVFMLTRNYFRVHRLHRGTHPGGLWGRDLLGCRQVFQLCHRYNWSHFLREATVGRMAKNDFYLPCVILWLLILSEDTRRSPGRRTWQWTRTCGKRRYKILKKHKAI